MTLRTALHCSHREWFCVCVGGRRQCVHPSSGNQSTALNIEQKVPGWAKSPDAGLAQYWLLDPLVTLRSHLSHLGCTKTFSLCCLSLLVHLKGNAAHLRDLNTLTSVWALKDDCSLDFGFITCCYPRHSQQDSPGNFSIQLWLLCYFVQFSRQQRFCFDLSLRWQSETQVSLTWLSMAPPVEHQ